MTSSFSIRDGNVGGHYTRPARPAADRFVPPLRGWGIIPGMPLVQRLANTLAFERRCIRSSFVAQVRRTLPVRLHLRALLARRIDALDTSGYLRDATLGSAYGTGGGTCLLRPPAVLLVLVLRGVVAGGPVVPFRERLRLPLLVLRPAERKLPHGARGRHRLEGRERLDEDFALQIGLVRLSGRVSEGEVEERRAGGVDRPGDGPRARHAERRDRGGLRVPCDQSHGLVADGANGHQQDGVDA